MTDKKSPTLRLSFRKERKLVMAYRQGDPAAHQRLQKYLESWFSDFFRRHNRCVHTAVENLHLTSIKVALALAKPIYPIRGRLRPYATRIAFNVQMNHFRRVSREKRLQGKWILKTQFGQIDQQCEMEVFDERREWVEKMIPELTEQQQKVWRKYCDDGLSTIDIGDQLGVSRRRIRQILASAVGHLCRLLKRELSDSKSRI